MEHVSWCSSTAAMWHINAHYYFLHCVCMMFLEKHNIFQDSPTSRTQSIGRLKQINLLRLLDISRVVEHISLSWNSINKKTLVAYFSRPNPLSQTTRQQFFAMKRDSRSVVRLLARRQPASIIPWRLLRMKILKREMPNTAKHRQSARRGPLFGACWPHDDTRARSNARCSLLAVSVWIKAETAASVGH